MDRNQAIGLVLIAGLLIVYSLVFKTSVPEEPIVNTADTTSVQQAAPETPAISQEEISVQDTSANDLSEQFGVFAVAMQGTEETFVVETDNVKYTFNNKGGRIQSVELKDYVTFDQKPLILFDKSSSNQTFQLPSTKGNIDFNDLYFRTSSSNQTLAGDGSTTIRFVANLGSGKSIEQTYTIYSGKYDLEYQVKVNGLNNDIVGNQMGLVWANAMKRFEKNLEDSRNKTTIRYYTLEEDSDNLKAISTEPQQETISGVKWLSFSQKFFNAGIIAEKGISQAIIGTSPSADTTVVKDGLMQLAIPMADVYEGANFKYYYGPQGYKRLKKVAEGYEDNVYMGYKLVSWVNKYIIVELFGFLERFIGNYGVIIMIIVLIVKLVLFPLSRKSYLSMAKMKALKPELDALKEKHGGDMQKMQQDQMALYRQVGVNPVSGCVPLLLQMPILFAMFFFFPNSIELRQQSFLWANDLSTYDVLVNLPFTIPFYGSHVSGFTLLMTISTLLYTWSNNQVSSVQGPMKSIGYVMPVIFMFVLNSYSSGLSFYYFVSNIITFGQQTLIRRFVDDDKIRATLEENKKKNANKKKSKFQARLEEAMKASQEAQRQKQQQKNKGKKK